VYTKGCQPRAVYALVASFLMHAPKLCVAHSNAWDYLHVVNTLHHI
jgi:hypothetical protein